MGPLGLEPRTKGLWVPCSNQLSYRPVRRESITSAISVIQHCKKLGETKSPLNQWVCKVKIRRNRGSCAIAPRGSDDVVCVAPWLRFGGYVRECHRIACRHHPECGRSSCRSRSACAALL